MCRAVAWSKGCIGAVFIALGAGACDTRPREVRDEALAEGKRPRTPSPLDERRSAERTYRTVELDNGLRAFLIHDAETTESAAALSVAVGSLEDPAAHLGLAHLLEHVLSQGTHRYPAVGEYERYITAYRGHRDAYTSAEETNFHFTVSHDGFAGSLGRFAQLFIAPPLSQEDIAWGVNAVHSEHQQNLHSDLRRTHRISALTSKAGHPRQRFATGNRETLKNVTRPVIVAFYTRYYSANTMRLATISSLPLDTQEEQVRQHFAALPNNDRAELTYDEDIYDDSLLPQRIDIEPVTDVRQVVLAFALPSGHNYWQSKPHKLLSSLIGAAGKGSLLSLLKARGYATALLSSFHTSSHAGEFAAEITLTKRGLAEVNEVVALFFSYIAMLRREGLKDYFYNENKQLAQIEHDYRAPLEGADAVTYYASIMHRFAPRTALRNDRLFFDANSSLTFRLFLNRITPRKLRMMVIAKGVTTDLVEPHYGINYRVNTIPASLYRVWENPHSYEALHYPAPNQFMPTNFAILADDERDEPYKLLDTEQGVFWFQQDTKFLRPKANLHLNLLTAKTNTDPRQALLSVLYTRAWQESTDEWRYPLLAAGLHFTVTRHDRGINIDLGGYAAKLPLLISEIGKRLRTITIDETTFAALKDDLQRELANTAYQQGHLQVAAQSEHILDLHAISAANYAGMIDSVTLAELHTYCEELYREVAFAGIAYGNLDKVVLADRLNRFMTALNAATLPAARRRHEQILRLKRPYTYSFSSESNNHAMIKLVQMGERSPQLDAQLRIINTHLGAAFSTAMHSKQQLAHIAHAGLYYRDKVLGLRFIVQSSTHNPVQIGASINDFLPTVANHLAEITAQQLADYKQSVMTKLQQPQMTIAAQHHLLRVLALRLDGDFAYHQKLSAAVRKVTRDDLINTWNDSVHRRQLNIALFAKGTTIANLPHTDVISDIALFKQEQPIYGQEDTPPREKTYLRAVGSAQNSMCKQCVGGTSQLAVVAHSSNIPR